MAEGAGIVDQPCCCRHPHMPGLYWCDSCEVVYCEACTESEYLGNKMIRRCTSCRTILKPPSKPDAPELSMTGQLVQSLTYPLAGRGKWMIVVWSVLITIIKLLSFLPLVGAVAFLIGFCLSFYLFACMLQVVACSASGDDEPPDWPELTNIWDDVIRPAMMLLATFVVSFLPAIFMGSRAARMAGASLILQGAAPLAGLIPFYACLGLGLLYLPMALLSVTLTNSLAGLDPFRVGKAIFRIWPTYLLIVVISALVFMGWRWLGGLLLTVPFAGVFLDVALGLYTVMLEMRILGLIYKVNEKRLGWFT